MHDEVEVFLAHRRIGEVVGVQDMAVVVQVGRDNAVGERMPRRVDIQRVMLVEEVLVLEVVQGGEHGAVLQVVAVEHRHGVAEIGVVGQLGVDGSLDGVVAVFVMVEVEEVVRGALQHREVHIGAGNVDPRVDIGVLLLQRREVDGVFHPVVGGILCGLLHHRFRRVLHLLGHAVELGLLPDQIAAPGGDAAQEKGEEHREDDNGALLLPRLEGAGGLRVLGLEVVASLFQRRFRHRKDRSLS